MACAGAGACDTGAEYVSEGGASDVSSGSGAAGAGREASGASVCSSLMLSGSAAMKMDTISVGAGNGERGREMRKALVGFEKLVSGCERTGSGIFRGVSARP